jgi:hypothetical protein
MTTLPDRPNTALVVVDVQKGVVDGAPLVADAHTTEDPSQWGAPLDADQVIAHTNLYWTHSEAPGRKGGTVATADVSF